MITINQPIPTFSAITQNGNLESRSLLGKNIILYFYPKDSTPGCTIESCGFRDYIDEFKKLNTEVIGISRDSIKSHEKFIAKHDLNFLLVSDEDEKLCKLFDVLKQKSMMGKKYIGIERSTFLIDKNGVLKQEWRDVSVMGHVKAVLAAAKELS